MGKLNLNTAEQERVQLTQKQQKHIEQIYKSVAKDIDKRLKNIPQVPSDTLKKQYLEKLKEQVLDELNKSTKDLQDTIEGNMKSVAESVIDSSLDFAQKVGLSVEGLYSNVPDEIVKSVATGKLYEGNWSLSKAIWKGNMKTQYDVNTVVAKGIAENKSAYDIAKDLEKYLDPSAKKDWDWSKVYPGTARKVDYNAQRLARTMVSHAYQQAFVRSTIKNPFVTMYKWDASNSARTCPICAARDGQLFKKTDLPLDHPNGMCTFEAVIPDSMTDIADRVADWALGGSDPELDAYYNTLIETQYGGTVSKNFSVGHSVVDGKDISATFSRNQEFQFPIEDAIHQQGFDGLPRVVDKATFEQAVSDSKLIAQRTFSADTAELLNSYNDMLLNGKWYVDCSTGGSQYGMGMYCASDYTGTLSDGIRKEMEHYIRLNKERLGANAQSMVKTFTLDKSSKVISFEDALDIASKQFTDRFLYGKTEIKWFSEDFDDYRSIDLTKLDQGKLNSILQLSYKYEKSSSSVSVDELTSISHQIRDIVGEDKSLKRFANNVNEFVDWSTSDVGMEAALKGYDAIRAAGHGESGSYTVILNRTKLIVLEDAG